MPGAPRPDDLPEASDIEADRAIMAFVRNSREHHDLRRVGRFLMLLTSETKLRFLNYAIPDDGVDPDDAELDALVAAFRNAERMPRVEFLPSVAPALEPALTSRGWTVEDRLPLMTCTARTLRTVTPPSGTLIEPPQDDRELFEMNRLQHEIFEDPAPADDRSVARVQATLDRGGRALIGRDIETRAVVGAAQTAAPGGGATEVVGVVVAPSHRRRGLAAALVSELARECLGSGLATVFLEAAPGADGAYRNAGFRRTSTSMHISLKGEPDA